MISGLSGYLKGVKKAIGNIGHGNQPTTPTLGRIRIGSREVEEIKLIAQGGYAYVFKVRDVQTNEIFALKKMVCQSPERLSTAKNEINMLRSLPPHPNLLEVFDSFVEQKDHCYYVYVLLEFCADGSIFDLMEKYESTRLSEKQIIFIMREVCEGVKVLHTMNPPVAHRDLKIENVLLNNKKFKLCDFGSCSRSVVDFAKVPQNKYNDYEEEYDKNCTLMYRPPEMCDPYLKQIVCEKVDIWMIGCILYTMCFYKHPFQEMTKLSIVNAAYTFPAEHPYPQKMVDLIRLLLTPNPRTRPSIFEACELFQNYFSLDSIKLNADAIKVREEQKKQAMELKKFEGGSSRKFNGDIPEDELMKLQQKLAKTDFYGDNDDPSPIHDHNLKSHHRKNSSNGSLKAQAKTSFEDFGSFGGNKPNKVELTHFNSSPGLSSQQGNDWYNFGSTTSKSSSSNQQTQQGQHNHHQSAQTSSFGQQAKNNQSQQATDPKVNEQWKNFDFNSVPQNSNQSNNNNNSNNNANKAAPSWGNNNWGNSNQPQPTMNKPVPQQQNLQNLYQQQGNVQNQGQGWNQNINQAQFASTGNRGMQPQFQNNFQGGFNQQMNPQNMNKGNAGWNNFGNVPQNNMMNNNMNNMNYHQNNNNNNFGYNNNMGGQKPIQQTASVTVTNNLLDLADTKPKKLDTASGIMSLYGNK